jgi:hypothetical protein
MRWGFAFRVHEVAAQVQPFAGQATNACAKGDWKQGP